MNGIGVSPQKSAASSSSDIIDRTEALSRVEGDRELMASLVTILLSEADPMMKTIRDAVQDGDPGKLEKAAHRLKGSVSVFCADTVTQAALELEKIGRSGNLSSVAESLARLEQLMASLQPALKQFSHELQS